jgi:hypothetical protein
MAFSAGSASRLHNEDLIQLELDLNLAADKPTTVQVSNCRFLGLNKLRHKLLHYPALTDVSVCSRTYKLLVRVSLCFVKMYNMYISPTLMWIRCNGIRCSNGTPIINKPNPSLFIKGGTTKGKKTNILTLNKYMAMDPSGVRCQEWPCWLVASSKLLLCSALLCSARIRIW